MTKQKQVPREKIFEALEFDIASATKKKNEGDIAVSVRINRETGEFDTFRRCKVIPDDMDQDVFVALSNCSSGPSSESLIKVQERFNTIIGGK